LTVRRTGTENPSERRDRAVIKNAHGIRVPCASEVNRLLKKNWVPGQCQARL